MSESFNTNVTFAFIQAILEYVLLCSAVLSWGINLATWSSPVRYAARKTVCYPAAVLVPGAIVASLERAGALQIYTHVNAVGLGWLKSLFS